jgi:hypothetical protein
MPSTGRSVACAPALWDNPRALALRQHGNSV